ncbi:MAG: GWxTD domain-containing protein [Cyclobacteriaceae bacterium]|nr:GWxTD domain-containing protein [Cyclobacteriaceae bacterium]
MPKAFFLFSRYLGKIHTGLLLPIVCISVFATEMYAQLPVFKENNIKYYYDVSAEMFFNYRLYTLNTKHTAYFSISLLEDRPFAENYKIVAELRQSHEDANVFTTDTLDLERHFMGKNVNEYYFSYEFENPYNAGLLVVNVLNINTRQIYAFDITLSTRFNFRSADILPVDPGTDKPILRYFFTKDRPIVFQPVNNANTPIYAFYYGHDFEVADPPMVTESQQVSRGLELDSTFTLNFGESVSFAKEGLYLLQLDTTGSETLCIRVHESDYPRFTLMDDLIKPLIYITTRNEINVIREAGNRKREEFEKFWLTNTRSEDGARTGIRLFYRKVQESNYLFTNYKEGWKTDKGMVYIIFGPPDKVVKGEQIEEWIYQGDVPTATVNFTFVKVKNIFSNNHYALIRDRKYERNWFRTVESWRRGRLRR